MHIMLIINNGMFWVAHVMNPLSAPMTRNIVPGKQNIFEKSDDNGMYMFLKDGITIRCGAKCIRMNINCTQIINYILSQRSNLSSVNTEIDENMYLLWTLACNWIIFQVIIMEQILDVRLNVFRTQSCHDDIITVTTTRQPMLLRIICGQLTMVRVVALIQAVRGWCTRTRHIYGMSIQNKVVTVRYEYVTDRADIQYLVTLDGFMCVINSFRSRQSRSNYWTVCIMELNSMNAIVSSGRRKIRIFITINGRICPQRIGCRVVFPTCKWLHNRRMMNPTRFNRTRDPIENV